MPRKRRRVADGDAPAAGAVRALRPRAPAGDCGPGWLRGAGLPPPGPGALRLVPCGRGLADHSRKLPLWKKGRDSLPNFPQRKIRPGTNFLEPMTREVLSTFTPSEAISNEVEEAERGRGLWHLFE
ncbi:hypothetical protein R6Z07F_001363 [Ovis aries]